MTLAVQEGFDFTPRADTAPEGTDWHAVATSLDRYGNAILPALLTPAQCDSLTALYADDARFRSTIVMARHNFGRGEYRYFAYPLPPLLDALRHALYARLAPIANRWHRQLGIDEHYPDDLDTFLARCHRAGQTRPTPLILRYGSGDYNCLHQDLYGDHVFPLQVAILLSAPERDFTGGEFVMTESASSGSSAPRAEVVPLAQGDAVVFAVHHRPAAGKRGGHRKVAMRHGVSVVRSGNRYTVGLIFHEAR
ncbi:2OG-Fe(II) oxygenase [Paraburkholderia sp. J94]|uniref:2OG-Fe(II) oxygenase n=1 Tax=Paraburkholderia sp. J94 TaxID=2805441 RepID=UPI002AAF6596|nr:2OG-Fe(II) oxygenase [Paraburkholderia sp. J94]